MGLFDKLFGKKKNDDVTNLLKQISRNQSSISASPNYQSVFFGLKGLYFTTTTNFEAVSENEEKAREFVKQALDITQKAKGIRIPQEFYDMPIHMYSGKGIVLEIPNPLYECECNYVALLCGDSKKMYTNEYYASSKTFGLCCITESMRMSLKAETDNFEKFVKATIGV